MEKILFFLAHPAHYHLFKNVINQLKTSYKIKVIIVTKDVLEELVAKENWDYVNLIPEGRRVAGVPILISTIIGMFKTEYRMLKILWRQNFKLLIGTEGTLAHLGFLFRIKSLMVNEDDTSVTPENYLVYPFSSKLLLPHVVDNGMWGKKRVEYNGYHELAYLDKKSFVPDRSIVEKANPGLGKYFIIRLALLTASHDIGKEGINDDILRMLIEYLISKGKVFITSEKPLAPAYEMYRVPVSVHDIHHFLHYADLYIGDSQTMAMESAILGTPTIRFNSFARQCSVILELEKNYGLVHSFLPTEAEQMFQCVKDLVENPVSKQNAIDAREKLLREKEDVVRFLIDQIKKSLGNE
jgi:predicted glycosyltransferase